MVRGHPSSEKKSNAPRPRKGNESVNNSAENSVLPAEKPRYDVKLKQPHTSPIGGANDRKNQRNPICNHP
jgi:hypothetical protein